MDQFKVLIKFKGSDEQHLDTDWCDVEKLQDSLRRLLHGPAAAMGIISEILVIDSGDSTVFLVQDGKQIWPEAA